MRLKGKVALVTGSATGIGAGIVRKLSSEQAQVVINYYGDDQKSLAEDLIAEIAQAGGAEARICQADVGDLSSLTELFRFSTETFGKLDILVNNAVTSAMAPVSEFTEEQFDKVFRVNVKGVFFACQLGAKTLGDGGRIINLSSNSTSLMLPNYGLYDASKGAVEQITRVLSKELGPRGITVNAVSPGPIYTPIWDERPEEFRKQLASLSSMNRFGTIEEVANVVAFLASDEASWITGQNIRVNGGAT